MRGGSGSGVVDVVGIGGGITAISGGRGYGRANRNLRVLMWRLSAELIISMARITEGLMVVLTSVFNRLRGGGGGALSSNSRLGGGHKACAHRVHCSCFDGCHM